MSLVETDCPLSRGPCADQQWPRGLVRKEREQRATDSPALMCRSHVCVTDQGGVANKLTAHDPDEGV